ncbi:hypothetical protein [Klebsiella quasivariicola]|uniref:hypothetical protein n=1 Tax=Klebsiella quasivariicola TaxID=2026240 RepID=UPI00247AFB3D|nr:hypothetical protein [Klebsiella quasivariicola]
MRSEPIAIATTFLFSVIMPGGSPDELNQASEDITSTALHLPGSLDKYLPHSLNFLDTFEHEHGVFSAQDVGK